MSRLRRTAGHTAVYAFALIINRGISYALIPLYTRNLSLDDIAVWEICMTTIMFLVPVLELGMGSALIRFYHSYEQRAQQASVFSTAFAFVGLLGGFVTVLLLLAAKSLSELVFQADGVSHVFRLLVLVSVVSVLGNLPLAWLRTQERSAAFAGLSLLRATLGPGVILYLIIYGDMGVEGILWGELAGVAALALGALVVCRNWFTTAIDSSSLYAMLKYAIPLLPVAVSGTVLTVSDRYFVAAWLGVEALAVYAIGAKAGVLIQFFTQAFQSAYPPAAFQIAKNPDPQVVFATVLKILHVLLFLFASAIGLLSFEIVLLLGGDSIYGDGAIVVPFVAFSYVLHTLSLTIMAGLAITKKTVHASFVICTAGIVKIALNFLLIGAFGIEGAAVATLLAHVTEFVLAYIVTQAIYPVSYDIRRMAGSSFLIVSVTALGLSTCEPLDWSSIAIRGGLFASLCVASCLLAMSGSERERVWLTLRKRLHGTSGTSA